LRELGVRLGHDDNLKRAVGWGGISISQLIKLQHKRPPELWAPLIANLLSRLKPATVGPKIRIMDTSFFTMGLKLLKRHHDKTMDAATAGYKLGVVLDPACAAPVRYVSDVGQGSDTGWLDRLVPADEPIAGIMFLFDRGFRKYAFFDKLIERGADFITRATALIRWETVAELPPDPARPAIIRDHIVRLGAAGARNRMENVVRRIVLDTGTERIVFITSDRDSSAWQIAELYRLRWEIETFFRWFKRSVGCVRPLGYSLLAAQHTFCAALVAYLLVLLLADWEISPSTGRETVRVQPTLHRIRATLGQRPTEHDLNALGFL